MVDSRIMMTSHSSTMASSLERSLEMGAIHSDGLSDKERAVRQVKHSIKGHRRTHSVRATQQSLSLSLRLQNPNAMSCIVDESTSDESDDVVDI